MDTPSRRSFLAVTGATAAAIGAAAILPASAAEAETPAGEDALSAAESAAGGPLAGTLLMACVTDLQRGEVTVITDDDEITVTDPGLAGLIASISRSGA